MESPSYTRLTASARVDNNVPSFRDSWSSVPSQPQGIPFPQAYSFFMNPWVPFIFSVVYFITAKTLNRWQDGKDRIPGRFAKALVVLHNIFLAGYSGWTCLSTAPVILGSFYRAWAADGLSGLTHAFCDSNLAIWTATQFPFHCYHFYLSKFYEVVDTAIILAKGKKVGMLQSYHHAGAVWTMFAGFRSAATPIWLFVCFNSFVHTVMYAYYAFTALRLPFPRFLKKSITKLQITQFLIGGSLAASYLFIRIPTTMPSSLAFAGGAVEEAGKRLGAQCLVNGAQKAAVWLNVAYLIPLTYLFGAFFVKSYRKNSSVAAAAKRATKEVKAE